MRDLIKNYTQPAFLLCVMVLITAGSGTSIVIKKFGVYLQKEHLPLRRSLEALDANGLAPYKIIKKSKIENEEVVKSLGTEDYIQWILEDTGAELDSDVRRCYLFVTYYGIADRVPHVPEECYTGGGSQQLASESTLFDIKRDSGNSLITEQIYGRHLVFSPQNSNLWQNDSRFSVLYLFNINNVYADSRESARVALNKNLFSKHSYFSKVEWNFMNRFNSRSNPNKKKTIEASQKLLSVILPILENEHWPIGETLK